MDRRSRAREITMQVLYQLDVQGNEFLDQLDMFVRSESDDDLVRALAEGWSKEAWANMSVCDESIKKAATKWDLARMSAVDRSILRLGAYQMKFCSDIPGKVIINEAIEIAKKYSGSQSPRFINGVLDAVLGDVRYRPDRSEVNS